MRDAAADGADMPPAQLDETLEDLAFFLDEFGSTRAVRMKLQEQESDIKRFQDQVQRLVNIRSGGALTEETEKHTNCEENTTIGTENAIEVADETRAELDFLRPYGSMRAVRETLERQTREIMGLQRTVEWLRERRSRARRREDASDAGVDNVNGCPAPALTLETRDDTQDGDTSSMGESDRVDGVDGDDVEMASPEEERTRGGGESVKKVKAVPTEASEVVIALPNLGTDRHADEAVEDRRLEPNNVAGNPTESNNAVVPDLVSTKTSTACLEKENPDSDPSAAVETIREKPKKRCSFRGCEKWSRAHGLCCVHDGFQTCSVESCDLIAAAWGLCQQHGGVTRCSVNGCKKTTVFGGHGHCFRHARAQGFLVPGECKIDGCSCFRASDNYRDTYTAHEKGSVATASQVIRVQAKVRDHGIRECKELGCRAKGIDGGEKKGYCFQHGGGHRCQAEGCTKARRQNGFCFAHGRNLKSGCTAEGCRKLVVENGYCVRHFHARAPSRKKAPPQRFRQV